MEHTNILTMLSAVFILPFFYVMLYVFKQNYPWIAFFGLALLTLGMLVDGLHWMYIISTGLAVVVTFWGAVKSKPNCKPPF